MRRVYTIGYFDNITASILAFIVSPENFTKVYSASGEAIFRA